MSFQKTDNIIVEKTLEKPEFPEWIRILKEAYEKQIKKQIKNERAL